MPVLVKLIGAGLVPKSPAEVTRMFDFKLRNSGWPDYRDDPTYDLKKKRRR